MLTPIDIQNKTLKTGMGYNKKDVDDFLIQIIRSYEELYKENIDIKEKIGTLSEGIQYYKSIETTLQKALVLAEKTSKETQDAAVMKAEALERDARVKADLMLADAKSELESIRNQTINLVQNYESFRMQFKKLVATQLELIDGDSFKIYAPDIDNLMKPDTSSFSSESLQTSTEPIAPSGETVEELEAVNRELADSINKLSASVAAAPTYSEPVSAPVTPAYSEPVSAPATPAYSEPTATPVTPAYSETVTAPVSPTYSETATASVSPMLNETATASVSPVYSEPAEKEVSIASMLQENASLDSAPQAPKAPASEIYKFDDIPSAEPESAPQPSTTDNKGYIDELRFDTNAFSSSAPAAQSGNDDIQFEFISTEE